MDINTCSLPWFAFWVGMLFVVCVGLGWNGWSLYNTKRRQIQVSAMVDAAHAEAQEVRAGMQDLVDSWRKGTVMNSWRELPPEAIAAVRQAMVETIAEIDGASETRH